MARRLKPMELSDVRVHLARIVPMLRSMLVLLEDLAENLSVEVGASLRDLPAATQSVVHVRPRHPTATTHVEAADGTRSTIPARARTPEVIASRQSSNGSIPHHRPATGEIAVLTAIAQRGTAGATRQQVKLQTGYTARTVRNHLSPLRGRAWIREQGERIFATEDGVRALGSDFRPLPTGRALLDWWMHRLDLGEQRVLAMAVSAYPDVVGRERLSEELRYTPRTVRNHISPLKTRLLITVDRDGIRASDLLFDADGRRA